MSTLLEALLTREQREECAKNDLRLFLVRYGQDKPFEVMARDRHQVEDQHYEAALLQGKGLSVREVRTA